MINNHKLISIEEIFNGTTGNFQADSDFTSEETEFLSLELNIRFRISELGCFCYFSTKPGAGGFGKTYLEAFCLMLKRLEFKRNSERPLMEDLTLFFSQLK